jgi:phage baseplate assembly protein gpV
MLYVDGTINSLSGPGQAQMSGNGVVSNPAIQDGTQLTIVAASNVNITGDVTYHHEPVTMDTSNTLIAGNDFNQVLGIYSNAGNINLQSPYSNQNLQVDGSLAVVGSTCSTCGFTASGHINTFNNVGGQIQTNIFSADMNTENTYFDRRFTSKSGFMPPWFPSTTVPPGDIVAAGAPNVTYSFQRRSWATSPQ